MATQSKNIFVKGPVSPDLIAASIRKHSEKTGIGGHSIFLGQVRADVVGDQTVHGIEYTAYEEMALEQMQTIRDEIFSKYPIICMHVHHSLGLVKTGEISLFVFTSSKHRKAAMDACEELVNRIKTELPIWGKELMGEDRSQWKAQN